MQKLAKKFVAVMQECAYIVKTGTNDFHRYKYATAADVLEKSMPLSLSTVSLLSSLLRSLVSKKLPLPRATLNALPLSKLLSCLSTRNPVNLFPLKDLAPGKTLAIKLSLRLKPWLSNTVTLTALPLLLVTTPKPILRPTRL